MQFWCTLWASNIANYSNISICSSDVKKPISKAGNRVTPRKYQLSIQMLNALLILNTSCTYGELFLPRNIRNVLRAYKLKTKVKFHCETQIFFPADSADIDLSCDDD